jgi:thymidylate synthase ThyX
VIEQRTDPAAEEEIRLLFSMFFSIVKSRYPNIFADYEIEEVNKIPWVKTKHKKV